MIVRCERHARVQLSGIPAADGQLALPSNWMAARFASTRE
jgi:hypothetical protein